MSALLGVSLVVLVFLVVAGILYWVRYGAMDRGERTQVARVNEQLSTLSMRTMSIPAEAMEHREQWRKRIAWLFTGQAETEQRARDAAAEVWSMWRERTTPIGGLTLKLGYETAALAILAAIVLIPTSVITEGILPSGGGFSIDAVADGITATTGTIAEVIWMFPAADVLWALTLAAAIRTSQAIVENVVVLIVLLTIGVAALEYFDRQSERRSVAVFEDRRGFLALLGGVVVSVWAAGVLGRLSGLAIAWAIESVVGLVVENPWDFSALGMVLGFGLAVGMAIYLGRVPVRRLRHQLSEFRRELGADSWREPEAAHQLVRKTAAALGAIGIPVLLIYFVRVFASGALVAKVQALLSAPLSTQLLVVLVVLAAGTFVVSRDPDEWAALRDALGRALNRRSIRTALFARGLPVSAIIAVTVFAASFGAPVHLALGGGLVVAAVIRVAHRQWQRISLQLHERAGSSRTPQSVTVSAGRIDDPGGDKIYIAQVGMRKLAWPTFPPLVEQVMDDLERKFGGDQPALSDQRAYYKHIDSTGMTDLEEFETGERARARELIRNEVEPGHAEVETVRERVTRHVSENAFRRALQDLEQHDEVVKTDGRMHWHGRINRAS